MISPGVRRAPVHVALDAERYSNDSPSGPEPGSGLQGSLVSCLPLVFRLLVSCCEWSDKLIDVVA